MAPKSRLKTLREQELCYILTFKSFQVVLSNNKSLPIHIKMIIIIGLSKDLGDIKVWSYKTLTLFKMEMLFVLVILLFFKKKNSNFYKYMMQQDVIYIVTQWKLLLVNLSMKFLVTEMTPWVTLMITGNWKELTTTIQGLTLSEFVRLRPVLG